MRAGEREYGHLNRTRKQIKSIADLTPDARNANKGTERGVGMLEHSLRTYGAGRSIVVADDGTVIAGNKTLERAVDIGLPARIVETDGRELIVVQRTDIAGGSKAARELAIADNRASEIGLDWDADVLKAELVAGEVDLKAFWLDDELDALFAETVAVTAPQEFKEVNENIETEYTCPKCGYQWSGGKNSDTD